jgi:hypothetical protein
MKVKKVQMPAKIYCNNGVLIQGMVHLIEGERTLDFANEREKSFIPVTKVAIYYTEWPYLKKPTSALLAKKDVVILNKSSILWIEEDTTNTR